MKRITSILVLVVFLFIPFIPRAEQIDVNLKDENSSIAVFNEGKKITIYFSNKLDHTHELDMVFDLSNKKKLRDYLEWKKKGILTKTIKKARIEIIEPPRIFRRLYYVSHAAKTDTF